MHLDLDEAVTLACFASPALDVEREATRPIAAHLGFGQLRKQFANRREEAGVGGRIRARSTTNRRLINVNHLVEAIESFDAGVCTRNELRPKEVTGQRLIEDIGDQRRLSRPGHASHRDEHAEGKLNGKITQIVFLGTHNAQRLPRFARPALRWHRDAQLATEIPCSQRVRMLDHIGDRSLDHHLTAKTSGARPEIDHVIRFTNRVLVVLHHDHRVAQVTQASKRVEQQCVVPLVQPDARLVEDVEHAHQSRSDLRGETNALGFTARQRATGTTKREVVEADIAKKTEALNHFLQDRAGDIRINRTGDATSHRNFFEERDRIVNRHIDDVADASPGHHDGE